MFRHVLACDLSVACVTLERFVVQYMQLRQLRVERRLGNRGNCSSSSSLCSLPHTHTCTHSIRRCCRSHSYIKIYWYGCSRPTKGCTFPTNTHSAIMGFQLGSVSLIFLQDKLKVFKMSSVHKSKNTRTIKRVLGYINGIC